MLFPSLELRDLESAIGKLPHEQRQVILLVGLEGMAYEEVAADPRVPVGTVRSRLSRGRDQLRRLMGMEEKLGENEHRAPHKLANGQAVRSRPPHFGQRRPVLLRVKPFEPNASFMF